MQGYRARRIITMAAPQDVLDDGMVWIHEGRIVDIGPYKRLKDVYTAPVHDLGPRMMVPGPVNAHTHLELSHLHGETCKGQGFMAWVQSLITLPMKTIESKTVHSEIHRMAEQGTAALGDISGHNPNIMARVHADSPLTARLFVEFLGFHRRQLEKWPLNAAPSDTLLSAAGHALYSTHPAVLQSVKSWTTQHERPFSIHLAEHAGEVDLLATGRGFFADFLRGTLLPSGYVPPGLSPVAYADRLGLLDSRTLAVHCVHLDSEDIQTLRYRGTFVCLCPRSNEYIGTGRAPAEACHRAGIPICLGTDGLTSNCDLNIWHEAEFLAHLWQGNLSLTELVSLITINPARALGLSDWLGSLQPGRLGKFSLVPDSLHHGLPLY